MTSEAKEETQTVPERPKKLFGISVHWEGGVPVPDTVFMGMDGQRYWKVERTTEGGSKYEATRRYAMDLATARDTHSDFLHPTLGLIWEGYKLARDRSPEDIMADTSIGGAIPPGELGLPQ